MSAAWENIKREYTQNTAFIQIFTDWKGGIDYMNTAFLSVTSRETSPGGLPRIICSGSWLPDMGFVTGALVQAIPEPSGISFTLCDENISRYSELSQSTDERNGKLIQVIFAGSRNNYGQMLNTSGQYILSGGLSVGDPLIAHYTYGLIRMRKLTCTVGAVGSYKDNRSGKTYSVIRLFGEWLAEVGFVRDALSTAAAEPGCIALSLHDNGVGQYSALVKYARENKLKIFQPRQYARDKSPYIEINDSFLSRAGFTAGDIFSIVCEFGLVKLQNLDLKDLGF